MGFWAVSCCINRHKTSAPGKVLACGIQFLSVLADGFDAMILEPFLPRHPVPAGSFYSLLACSSRMAVEGRLIQNAGYL